MQNGKIPHPRLITQAAIHVTEAAQVAGDEIHLYVVPATNLPLPSSWQSQEISQLKMEPKQRATKERGNESF